MHTASPVSSISIVANLLPGISKCLLHHTVAVHRSTLAQQRLGEPEFTIHRSISSSDIGQLSPDNLMFSTYSKRHGDYWCARCAELIKMFEDEQTDSIVVNYGESHINTVQINSRSSAICAGRHFRCALQESCCAWAAAPPS